MSFASFRCALQNAPVHAATAWQMLRVVSTTLPHTSAINTYQTRNYSWWKNSDPDEAPVHHKLGNVAWTDEYGWLNSCKQDKIIEIMRHEGERLEEEFRVHCLRDVVAKELHSQRNFPQAELVKEYDGGATFFTRTEGEATQFVQELEDGSQSVLLSSDEDAFRDCFHQITEVKLNRQQTHLVIILADGTHSEAQTCVIKPLHQSDGDDSAPLDKLEAVHSVEWMHTGEALVYSRVDSSGHPRDACLHILGTPQSYDRTLYEEETPGRFVHVNRTKDWRLITVSSVSKDSTEVFVMDSLRVDSGLEVVQDKSDGLLYWVTHAHGFLVILNNHTNPPEYDINIAPAPELAKELDEFGTDVWRPFVTSDMITVEDIDVRERYLVVFTREDGLPKVRWTPLESLGLHADSCTDVASSRESGQDWAASFKTMSVQDFSEVLLPDWAMAVQSGSNPDFQSSLLTLQLSAPAHLPSWHVFDLSTSSFLERPQVGTPNDKASAQLQDRYTVQRTQVGSPLVCTQDSVRSSLKSLPHGPEHGKQSAPSSMKLNEHAEPADGDTSGVVQVPMTVIHSSQVDPLAGVPILLRAYGAYGICNDLDFDPDDLSLLDRGVVIVYVHARGGGEAGRAWHQAGRQEGKWCSIQDYVTVLQFLLSSGITKPGRIGMESFSAGSLIAGHVLTHRPDLFSVAVFRKPFVNLLETMTDDTLPLTVHEYEEWGDPSEAGVTERLAELCPYQSIRVARYPPILITAALDDTRVDWWGPVKFAWRLRDQQEVPSPVMLQWGQGGHFSCDLAERAEQLAFVIEHLD